MAQQFLDGPEVGLALQEVGGEAVAQAVGRQARGKPASRTHLATTRAAPRVDGGVPGN